MENVKKAVKYYEAGDFEAYGEEIGEILLIATNGVDNSPIKATTKKNTVEMTAKVATGMMNAMNVGEFHFQALLVCIYELDQAALMLDMGIEFIEGAIHQKEPMELIGGAIAMVAFVGALRQSIPVCEQVDPHSLNWTEYDKIVKVLETPEKAMKVVGEEIEMNGTTITGNMAQAINDYEHGQY